MADDVVQVVKKEWPEVVILNCKEEVAKDDEVPDVKEDRDCPSCLTEIKLEMKEGPTDDVTDSPAPSTLQPVKMEPVDDAEEATSCGTSYGGVRNYSNGGDRAYGCTAIKSEVEEEPVDDVTNAPASGNPSSTLQPVKMEPVDDAEETSCGTGSGGVRNDSSEYESRSEFVPTARRRIAKGDKFVSEVGGHRSLKSSHFKGKKRIHSREKPHVCKVCDHNFFYSSNLKRHMITHTGEKPFFCGLCNYKCSRKGYLVAHMASHTGEKPFACNICDYGGNSKYSLNVHMRTHSGEEPFACKVCNYRGNSKNHLDIHIRTHTGEKPFACDVCVYKCTTSSHLKRHMLTHTRVKRLSCELCSYKCNMKDTLQNHMRTHTGEKPFAC